MTAYISMFFVFLMQIIIPLLLIIWLYKGKNKCKLDFITKVSLTCLYVILVYFVGFWCVSSFYLKFIFISALIIALVYSCKKSRGLPLYIRKTIWGWSKAAISYLLLILVIAQTISVAVGYTYKANDVIDLEFPLRGGTYYVVQGGNSRIINYHNTYPVITFAVDIVKLNKFGYRANGLYPNNPQEYEIFGETIYSPCEGKVLYASDNMPDQNPPEKDNINIGGNYVVIEYKGVQIFLCHMMKGSILVKEGDFVKTGQPIGRVGNSGNTTEPHLHIHAVADSVGIPIVFNNQFLKRNNLFIKEK